MEKSCVTTSDIQEKIKQIIVEDFRDSSTDFAFDEEDSLSEFLDSMEICMLIVRLENVYKINFKIEDFCKYDSAMTLAKKVYAIWEVNK